MSAAEDEGSVRVEVVDDARGTVVRLWLPLTIEHGGELAEPVARTG